MHTDIFCNLEPATTVTVTRFDSDGKPFVTIDLGGHRDGVTVYLTAAQAADLASQLLDVEMAAHFSGVA